MKIFKGLFAGGVIGAVLGLLFAPSKGDETRGKVKKAYEEGKRKFDKLKSEISKKEGGE